MIKEEKKAYLEMITFILNNKSMTRFDLRKFKGLPRLDRIPVEIFGLKELEILKLAPTGYTNHTFLNIPSALKNLKKLKELHINGISLQNIPKEIVLLSKLEILDVKNNQLQELPSELKQLKKLKHLSIGNNNFTEIPSVVFEISSLEELVIVDEFKIKDIPPAITQLKNLTKFTLSNSYISTFPSHLSQLPKLRILSMFYTDITEIPDEIENFKALEQLHLKYNDNLTQVSEKTTKLPKLEILDLTRNNLNKIPKAWFTENCNINITIRYNPIQLAHYPSKLMLCHTPNGRSQIALEVHKKLYIMSYRYNRHTKNISLNEVKNLNIIKPLRHILPDYNDQEFQNLVRLYYSEDEANIEIATIQFSQNPLVKNLILEHV